jgi:hypothetical protein
MLEPAIGAAGTPRTFNYELRGVQSNVTLVSPMHSMAHTGSSLSCRASSQGLSRALES